MHHIRIIGNSVYQMYSEKMMCILNKNMLISKYDIVVADSKY